MNTTYTVVWDGTKATDPYLCVPADVPRPAPPGGEMTPARCAAIVTVAMARGLPSAVRQFGINGQSVGWLLRKAKGQTDEDFEA